MPVRVLGEHFTRASSTLPFTGLNASTLLVCALGLLFGGALLVRAGRRRRRSA